MSSDERTGWLAGDDAEQAFEDRPFPALTPAQRLHLDVHGFVVVESALDDGEVARMLGAMQRLRDDLKSAQANLLATAESVDADGTSSSAFGEGTDESVVAVRGCRMTNHRKRPHNQHFMHILESDPAILEYLAHPKLVGMAEELVGGSVRLQESEATMNRREPELDLSAPPTYGFHAGSQPDIGTCERPPTTTTNHHP